MTFNLDDIKITLIENTDDVAEFLRWLSEKREFLGIDTETQGLDWEHNIRMIQFGDTKQGWCMDFSEWKGLARQVIDTYEGQFVAANTKFDYVMLEKSGIKPPWARTHDVRAMYHLLDNGQLTGLKPLSVKHLDPRANAGQRQLKEAMRKNGWTYETVPVRLPEYWSYGGLDPMLTVALAEKGYPEVKEKFAQAYDIELASTHVLAKMETRGVRIDLDYVRKTRDEWTARAEELSKWCGNYGVTRPRADAQIIAALQRDGVILTEKTPKSGKFKLDKEILEHIDHPLARVVLEIRDLTKSCSTYFDAFEKYTGSDEILHANVNPLGADTSRMSISRPSLQNLKRGPTVRDSVVAREDHVLTIADFAQIELRLLADYAKCAKMLEAINNNEDLHTITAQTIYGDPNLSKDDPRRQVAKNAGFAKGYGAGIKKFAWTAHVSEDEAAKFMQGYDQLYPEINKFQSDIINVVRQRARESKSYRGWVFGRFGRRLFVKAEEAYVGCNYAIQSTASDVLKRALIKCDAAGLSDYMAIPIHDEILADVPKDQADDFQRELIMAMEDRENFLVPLTAEGGQYHRWGDKYR